MSNHASANLFLGVIAYDPNVDFPRASWRNEDGEEIEEFDSWYCRNFANLERPQGEYPGVTDQSPEAKAHIAALHKFWGDRREVMDSLPIEDDWVGYTDGQAVQVLRLRNWGKSALDYGIEELTPASLIITPEQIQTFNDFLEQTGLSHLGPPSILLAATYG